MDRSPALFQRSVVVDYHQQRQLGDYGMERFGGHWMDCPQNPKSFPAVLLRTARRRAHRIHPQCRPISAALSPRSLCLAMGVSEYLHLGDFPYLWMDDWRTAADSVQSVSWRCSRFNSGVVFDCSFKQLCSQDVIRRY